MDSFNFQNHFQDIRVEKANAISRYRRVQRLTTLFRIVELFVFLIIVSRFSNQFSFSLKLSSEYFREISVTLISPRFVFLLGNGIVIALFLISGQFSAKNGEKRTDFYDEYVEKCRKNQEITCSKEFKKEPDSYKQSFSYDERKIYRSPSENQEICKKELKKAPDAFKHSVSYDERKIHRSPSENLERRVNASTGDERRRDLRRCVTEKCRKSVDCGRKTVRDGSHSYAEDEMSSEDFRRTVEAFIARQQRSLREEEDFSAAVVSI